MKSRYFFVKKQVESKSVGNASQKGDRMPMGKISGVVFALVVFFLSTGYAQQSQASLRSDGTSPPVIDGKRIALVIGNKAYSQGSLGNPVNDAESMEKALKRLHFEVTLERNVRLKSQLTDIIQKWGEKIPANAVALFYYAGHGAQVNGKNYLIPTSAIILNDEDVKEKGVGLDTVTDAMTSPAKNHLNIVILDACRNELSMRDRYISRGLAAFIGPRGTYIAYATGPGALASDGKGKNGLFTEHLLNNIERPALSIEDMFKLVRREVMEDKNNNTDQTPWDASSMLGQFFFNPGRSATPPHVPPGIEVTIRITIVPPEGAGPDRVDRIGGTVSGVDVKECKVVIFALGGNTWFVQPYIASPYTSIDNDGKWESDTHLGSEYAALLVKPSYEPPDKMPTLPMVGGAVLAIQRVPARK